MSERISRHRLVRIGTASALMFSGMSACSGSQDSNTPSVTVRDSAGVSIVHYSAEAMAVLPIWTIDDIPIEEITGETGGGFSAISDVVRRRDGRYVISDRQRRDIRMYDAGAETGQVIARPGRGPGEVGFVSLLQRLPGDSLGFVNAPFTSDLANSDTVFRRTMALITMSVSSDSAVLALDTMAVVPDQEIYYHTTTRNGETSPDLYPLRFGKATRVATGGRRVIVTTNDGFGFSEYVGERLIRRVRRAEPAAPFVAERDPHRYIVFDSTGRALARVQVPSPVVVRQATANEVIGTTLDENDIPRVERWKLRPIR
jgi:hypothetical protein